jgi:hypothetical protein
VKRDRSAFAYMEPHPDTSQFAQCGTCAMFLRGVGRCYWLGAHDQVDSDDSCVMYVQGRPDDRRDARPTGILKPETVGFYSGKVRCENCNAHDFRDPARKHCDLFVQLNRMFPEMWDLKTEIKPHACCNAWSSGERDPKNFGPYGPMPDADDPRAGGALSKLLGSKNADDAVRLARAVVKNK